MVNSVIYKAIFEAFSEASILTDCSGKILLFNKKAEVLLDLTLEEAIGKNITGFFELNNSSNAIKSFDNIFNAATKEFTVIADYIISKPNNEKLSIELSMQRIIADNEEYVYIITKDITEKKNSELLLLENESKLSAIIENTADSIFAVDIERNIIYLNEVFKINALKNLGVQLEKGMNLRDELPEKVRKNWIKRFDEAFLNVRLEFIDELNLDGNWLYIAVSFNPIVINEKVVGVSVFARNITEQKRIENALRESEAQLAELVKATFEGIVISKKGIIVNANEQFSIMVGCEQKELIGRKVLEFVSKESHEKVLDEISKAVNATYEHFVVKKSGNLIPVEIHGRSIIDEDDESVRFTAIRDISERKKTEQALKDSEEKYRKIFENIQDVFFQTNLSGVIVEVSPSSYPMLGYTREDVIGTFSFDLYENPEEREIVLAQLMTTGQVKDFEVNVFKKSGEVVPLSLNAVLQFDQNGNPHSIEGTLRDISARVAIEKEIKNQNRVLQIQNKELEQFTYVTSHDLQEPLRTLISISALLNDEVKKEEGGKYKVEKYLEFIVQSASRMQDLVKGLLDFSRIGKEKEISLVDCNLILSEVLTDLDYAIKESSAVIIATDLPVIKGYSIEVRLLFQNLLSNAIKFRRKNIPPIIDFSVQKQKECYCFSIKDNGIGIAKSDTEKIFVIFKRLHNRDDYEGTGIGLSHCKKIVELHGGTIWVDSLLGEGSVFNFTIPIL